MVLRVNEKTEKELAMLRYQAARYQATGNGTMSQQLNAAIRRIMAMNQLNGQEAEPQGPSQNETIN